MASSGPTMLRPLLFAVQRQVASSCQRQLSTSAVCSAAQEHSKHFPVCKKTMLPPKTFENKLAFVTGGATGLGKGLATTLSELGAKVVIASRSAERLQETSQEIEGKTGNKVPFYRLDIRDAKAVTEVLDQLITDHGLPDMVVNNAAGNFIAPTERLSPNAFNTVLGIVLNGTFYVTLDIGKRLIKAGKGASFLAVSADYATSGSGFVVPSACAKAGVEALTRSLASEWSRYGMRFNCISPGPIETKGAFSRLDPGGQFMGEFLKRIPLGRIGEVEEFTNLGSYLLSDYGSWINGQVIRINGGEFPAAAGMMDGLKAVTNQQWDALEAMIKSVKGS